jgi:acetate kinase
MKLTSSHILTINGGSSSIRFALFEAGEHPTPLVGREN